LVANLENITKFGPNWALSVRLPGLKGDVQTTVAGEKYSLACHCPLRNKFSSKLRTWWNAGGDAVAIWAWPQANLATGGTAVMIRAWRAKILWPENFFFSLREEGSIRGL
jgi:hypothetical protein